MRPITFVLKKKKVLLNILLREIWIPVQEKIIDSFPHVSVYSNCPDIYKDTEKFRKVSREHIILENTQRRFRNEEGSILGL